MLTSSIVRVPCPEIINGLTTADLGNVDYSKALLQHEQYAQALQSCGLEVNILEQDANFPDSTFVEDCAICLEECAIITRPGHSSRRKETISIEAALSIFYQKLEYIKKPGKVDGGDILKVEDHYYIGLSQRTNKKGAKQFIRLLSKYGKTGSSISLNHFLHLKTGVSYLGNNILLVGGELVNRSEFDKFQKLEVPADELYAANVIPINGTLLIPSGFPKTTEMLINAGFKIKPLEMSEFQKVDGGLSCLSLRF